MDNTSSTIKGGAQVRDSFDASMGLPKSYGDTKIVILPRDPLWFYAYWEVAADTYSKLKEKVGEGKFNSSRWALRVYDVTGIRFNGSNANRYFDIVIGFGADNWYVNVGEVAHGAWTSG